MLPLPEPALSYGLATYFDKLDLSEAIAHELAIAGPKPDWSGMPLRALIGDPFDLRRRLVMPAIETLTLRRDRRTGNGTFLLHWRDPAKVGSRNEITCFLQVVCEPVTSTDADYSTFAVMRRRGPRLAGLPGFLRLLLVGGMWGEIGRR